MVRRRVVWVSTELRQGWAEGNVTHRWSIGRKLETSRGAGTSLAFRLADSRSSVQASYCPGRLRRSSWRRHGDITPVSSQNGVSGRPKRVTSHYRRTVLPFRAPSAIRRLSRFRGPVISRLQLAVSISMPNCRERGKHNCAISGGSLECNYMSDRQFNRFPETSGQRDISQREWSRRNEGSETPPAGTLPRPRPRHVCVSVALTDAGPTASRPPPGCALLAMPRASPTFAPLQAQSRPLGLPARSGAHRPELRPSPCGRGRAVRRHLRDVRLRSQRS